MFASFGCHLPFVVILLLVSYALQTEDPIVTTKLGKVRGSFMRSDGNRKFLAFRGIPYAKPPLDDLRFKLPLPAESWTGILDATADGQPCLQLIDEIMGRSNGDEDCLYLNVYVPQMPEKNKIQTYPVMIYIHGGAFESGSGSSVDHGPQRFMDTSSIILVTINYRIGIFGFLCTEDKIAPGNFGLWDQNLALKWVQSNIEDFGGDPKLVTIFGESAGAGSVVLHLLSPHSKGLFSGAICQSGSAVSDRTFALHPLAHAKQLAKNLGCPIQSSAEMISCLKKKTAQEIIQQYSLDKTALSLRFWPVIDQGFADPAFVGGSPTDLLSKHNINAVPVISGANRDEGIFYFLRAVLANAVSIQRDDLFSESTLRELAAAISSDLMVDEAKGWPLYNNLVNEYFNGVDRSDVSQIIAALNKFVTDSKLNIYVDYTNKMLREHGAPVYVYKMTYAGKHTILKNLAIGDSLKKLLADLKFVVHVDELQFLFRMPCFESDDLPDEDRQMSDIMLNLWTSFAKTRVPSFEGIDKKVNVEWVPISPGRYAYLNLSLNPEMVQGELTLKPDLWETALEEVATKHRSLLQSSFIHKTACEESSDQKAGECPFKNNEELTTLKEDR